VQKSLLKTLLIMNLTTVFLLAICLSANAKVFSQRVSLSEKNVSLEKIFKEITRQTGYTFVYTRSLLKKSKNVSIKVQNAPIERSLDLCFKEQPLTYTILNKMVVIKEKEIVVPKEIIYTPPPTVLIITGKVTDDKGRPLEGATILVKGTQTGTNSDANGNFSIDAEPNSTLVISFVGFESTEVKIGSQTNISVQLKPTVATSDEVVVVGYGTKQRGEITGSISTLSNESLVKNRTTDLVKSMQGSVPGLIIKDVGGAPGREDASILIRGTHTLGDNTPLFVVDGVPQSSITQLSPYDIADISVLKDASAAIYGARAANGVIIVTTKRGKQGKTQLQFNSNYGVNSLTREPHVMNAWQWATYRNEILERTGEPMRYTEDDIEKYRSGSDPLTHPNTDWYKASFKKYATTGDHNLSVSGGSEKVQFFVSGSYHHEGTNYSSNDGYYHRYQLRSNIDVRVNKYLKIGADLNLRLQENRQPPAGIAGITHRAWFNYPVEVARYPNGLPGTVHEDGNTIVINSFETGYDEQVARIIQPKISFELNMDWLTEGMQLIGYASFNYNLGATTLFQKPVMTYAYDPVSDEYISHLATYPGGGHVSLNKSSSVSRDYLYHMRLVYNRRFGDHGISAFAAYEQDETAYEIMSAGRRDLYSRDKIQLFAGAEDGRTVGGSATDGGRVNYFGTISYDYMRKYLIDFTIRNDGSFNFPPGKRFGVFPSVSAAWNIYKESFMTGTNKIIDNLKLRFSYGKMGNDRIPAYQYITRYNTGTYAIFGTGDIYNPAVSIANVPNPNITWETSYMFNYGLDATLLKGKLNFTIDYFKEKRRGILITRSLSVPLYTAVTLPLENLGKVNNSGIELGANYSNNERALSYSIGGNFTFNRDKIVYMDEPKNIPEYQKREGHSVNSMLAYSDDGLFRDQTELDKYPHLAGSLPGDIKYLDISGDGKITADDMKRYYKSTTPEIQFGLNGSLKYKGFDLFILFQGQARATTAIRFNDDGAKPIKYFTERWTESNNDGRMPRATGGFSPYSLLTNFYFVDASYLRLKNLELGYNFSSGLISKDVFQEFRLYIRARNLWTLDHVKIFDPEVPFQSDPSRGSRAKYYPQLITYSVGINVTL
jgi:TonB-linked SusC/RagA family outer membrane protein